MNLYISIIETYQQHLDKIASEVNDALLEGIVHELSEDVADTTPDSVIAQAKQIITVAALESFYDDIIGPELHGELVDSLGASLACKIETLLEPQGKVALAKGKYDHIDFKPPQSVADAAARGLELRKQAPKSHKGGLDQEEASRQGIGSGVSRAVSLKNRNQLSPKTISMMVRFFARHNKNIEKAKKLKGKEKNLSKAYQAALLWGGSPGRSWANKVFRQMEAADKKSKKRKSK